MFLPSHTDLFQQATFSSRLGSVASGAGGLEVAEQFLEREAELLQSCEWATSSERGQGDHQVAEPRPLDEGSARSTNELRTGQTRIPSLPHPGDGDIPGDSMAARGEVGVGGGDVTRDEGEEGHSDSSFLYHMSGQEKERGGGGERVLTLESSISGDSEPERSSPLRLRELPKKVSEDTSRASLTEEATHSQGNVGQCGMGEAPPLSRPLERTASEKPEEMFTHTSSEEHLQAPLSPTQDRKSVV